MNIVHNDIATLFKYHPYRINGEKNPQFDHISAKILDLKEQKIHAVDFFAKKLDEIIPINKTICGVPPSSIGNCRSSGVGLVINELCKLNRIDASSCLYRHSQIQKLARGGLRSYYVHIESINLIDEHLIKDKEIYLLDDVVTTGNSLHACCEILKKNGAISIHPIAIGYTCYD